MTAEDLTPERWKDVSDATRKAVASVWGDLSLRCKECAAVGQRVLAALDKGGAWKVTSGIAGVSRGDGGRGAPARAASVDMRGQPFPITLHQSNRGALVTGGHAWVQGEGKVADFAVDMSTAAERAGVPWPKRPLVALGTPTELAKQGLTYDSDASHEQEVHAWARANASKIDEAAIRAFASLIVAKRRA